MAQVSLKSLDDAQPAVPDNKPTVADRHNNPLNIKVGGATKHWVDEGLAEVGEKAQDGGNFLKFVSPDAGFNAAIELLHRKYSNKDAESAMREWSNGGYGADEIGIKDPTTTIAQLDPGQTAQMIMSMAKHEGYHGGLAAADATPKRKVSLSKLNDTAQTWRDIQAAKYAAPVDVHGFDFGNPRFGKSMLGTAAEDIAAPVLHPLDTAKGLIDTAGIPLEGFPRERSETAVGDAWNRGDYKFALTRGLLNMVPFGPTVGGMLDQAAIDPATAGGHLLAAKIAPKVYKAALSPVDTLSSIPKPSLSQAMKAIKMGKAASSGNYAGAAMHMSDLLRSTSLSDLFKRAAQPIDAQFVDESKPPVTPQTPDYTDVDEVKHTVPPERQLDIAGNGMRRLTAKPDDSTVSIEDAQKAKATRDPKSGKFKKVFMGPAGEAGARLPVDVPPKTLDSWPGQIIMKDGKFYDTATGKEAIPEQVAPPNAAGAKEYTGPERRTVPADDIVKKQLDDLWKNADRRNAAPAKAIDPNDIVTKQLNKIWDGVDRRNSTNAGGIIDERRVPKGMPKGGSLPAGKYVLRGGLLYNADTGEVADVY